VSTLKALARKSVDTGEPGEGGLLLTVLDARRKEVYCRLDRLTNGRLLPEWEERSVHVGSLLSELGATQVVVTGETGQLAEGSGKPGNLRILSGNITRCSAGPVALEGEKALDRGERLDVRTLEPRYIKEFETRLKSTTQMRPDDLTG
jgi:tRNA A37 threonylcarbamoyladenosine modification protein TsaB